MCSRWVFVLLLPVGIGGWRGLELQTGALPVSGFSHGCVIDDETGEQESFLVPAGHGGGRPESGAKDALFHRCPGRSSGWVLWIVWAFLFFSCHSCSSSCPGLGGSRGKLSPPPSLKGRATVDILKWVSYHIFHLLPTAIIWDLLSLGWELYL